MSNSLTRSLIRTFDAWFPQEHSHGEDQLVHWQAALRFEVCTACHCEHCGEEKEVFRGGAVEYFEQIKPERPALVIRFVVGENNAAFADFAGL